MGTKKIDDFPAATTASGSDVALFSQGGVTKKLPLSLIPIPAATQAALDAKAANLIPRAVTAATTVTGTGDFVVADATSGPYTVTGPAAGTARRWGVKKSDTTANAVTIAYVNSAGTNATISLLVSDDAKVFEPLGSGYVAVQADRSRTQDDNRYLTGHVVQVTGLSVSDGAANTTAINNALIAVTGNGGRGGKVRLPRGVWPITGRVTLTNGLRLEGETGGGSGGYGGTVLQCTAAGAGVDVSGDGGGLAYLKIDGNDVAQQPMFDKAGADRLHQGVDVNNAAAGYDNWRVEFLQNSNYIGCTSNSAGRDGLVLDKECGGLLFSRFNISGSTRTALTIVQSVTPTTSYTSPNHLRFDHSLFERGKGNFPIVNAVAGFGVMFTTCILAANTQQASTPFMAVGTAMSWLTLDTCEWAGNSNAGQVAVTGTSGSRITLDGTNWMFSTPYFIDAPGAVVQVNGDVFTGSGAFLGPNMVSYGDQTALTSRTNALDFVRPATAALLLQARVSTETGGRLRIGADGRISWASGSDYNFNSSIYRRGDGRLAVDGAGLLVNGPIQSTNAEPITTVSASATIGYNSAFGAIHSTSSSAVTLTVPPNSTEGFYGVGTPIEIVQYGSGQVTVAAGTGVTIRTAASYTTRAQYSSIALRKIGTDEWLLTGDLT